MNQIFDSTVSSLFVLFLFIGIGVLLGRLHILPAGAVGTLSKLETCLFMPALIFRTLSTQCKIENIIQYFLYISVSTVLVILLFTMSFFVSKYFAQKDEERSIYTYALTVSNVGYMGQPITQSVFGDVMLMKQMIVSIPIHIYIYTLGNAMMSGRRISLRALLNPVFIATFLGMFLGLCDIRVPVIFDKVLSGAANCMSPIAMLIAGLSIAEMPVSKLLAGKRTYLVAFLRLVLIPAVVVTILAFLGLPRELLLLMLIVTAMPIGMNTIVFPASAGFDSTVGSKLVLISNLFSIMTIPLMFTVFNMVFPA